MIRSQETLRRPGHDHWKHHRCQLPGPGPRPGPSLPRELETVIPPVFIALFFFVVNIGTLQRLTESHLKGFDIKAFMLPTANTISTTERQLCQVGAGFLRGT